VRATDGENRTLPLGVHHQSGWVSLPFEFPGGCRREPAIRHPCFPGRARRHLPDGPLVV